MKPGFAIPGSPEATAAGCTCQPDLVKVTGPRGWLWPIAPDCPIHQGDPAKIAKSRQEIAEGKYWTLGPDGEWTPGPGIEPAASPPKGEVAMRGRADDAGPDEPSRPKPRKWKPDLSGPCCLACEKPFRRGDDVCEIGVCCIHAGCVKLYVRQCREIGIDP